MSKELQEISRILSETPMCFIATMDGTQPRVKERVLAAQPLIKGIYGSADNPVFASLCLEHGEYVIADFSGNPPRKGTF